MIEFKEWDDVQNLKQTDAFKLAKEILIIKGFTVYVVDIGGRWRNSDPHYLVYKNGHHIHYADENGMYDNFYREDKGYTDEMIKQKHVDALCRKLYTEDEIREPIKDYDDYEAKAYFLCNYYPMQEDYISIFGNFNDKEYEKWYTEAIKELTYNPVSFCYMANTEFIKHQQELMAALEERKDALKNDYEYYKKAFIREMYNHEYSINWQADIDTLSAFGGVSYSKDYKTIDEIFDDLNFTDTQRKAYIDARTTYYEQIKEAV